MSILQNFWRDTRGNSMQSIGFAAGAIAIASLAGSHLLEKSVQTGALQQLAGIRSAPSQEFTRVAANLPRPAENGRESLRQVTVDYTPTGSIPANLVAPIVLDPCTGMRK